MKYISLLALLFIAKLTYAQTTTVTSLADDGASGTFRWAILQANADQTINEIIFDPALAGTITLTSDLPNISETLTITGSGASIIAISGNNAFKMFRMNTSVILTISGLTFKQCGASTGYIGSIFSVAGSSVMANNIIVTQNTNATPFYSKDNSSLISISNSTFSANSSTLFKSDYGNTPSTTEPDAAYSNKIIVTGSTFSNNSRLIFETERFVKIDNCTFNNNTFTLGYFYGLNRYQVINSTFNNNTGPLLFYFASTIATGTFLSSLSANHHLIDANIFSGNTGTLIGTGNANEQQKTTITNNTFTNNGVNWDGNPVVTSPNYLDNFITSVSHNLTASTVTVTMSKPVYNAINSVGTLDVNDFQLSLTGGNATLISTTPSSLSVSGNVYTLGIQLNGITSGTELLKVSPVLNSIYDAANNTANVFQKNYSTNLKFLDDDLDGVANFMDQCPNTPTTNFVNPSTGCTDLTAGVIWNGPYLAFTKDDYADVNLPANQDLITSTVKLTRDNYGMSYSDGFINIASETRYDRSVSPSGTQWARVNNDQLTTNQIRSLNFTTSHNVFNGDPSRYENSTFLVYLPTEKIYFYLKLVSWSRYDGGFSYQRSTVAKAAPTGIALTATALDENLPICTVIGNLSTTDPDAGDTHTYTLVSGTGATDNSSFTIVGNQLKSAAIFDFETKASYSIRVRTTDAGGLTFERNFTIAVNDANEAPTAIALSATTINENLPIGTLIGNLSISDPDAGDTHTYTLVSGTGATDNSSFTIVGNQLKSAAIFDFETKASYSIRVITTDAGGLTFERNFTIGVNDANEAPTAIALSATTINENSPIGTLIGNLSISDPDAGDTHTYTLVSGTGATDNSSFTIVGNQLKSAAIFDFETKASYSIRVRTTDAGGLTFERNFTIAVNDANEVPTAIALSATTINENLPIGTLIGNLNISDPDAGDTHTYTLVSGTGATDNSSFTIVGNQLKSAAIFDFETKASYSIRLRTTDAGGLTFEKAEIINITDVNEAPTLNAIADFTTCATTAVQRIKLAGISAGPEKSQTVTLSLSSNNTTLLKNLAIGSISKGTADLSFSAAEGVYGTAIVTVILTDDGGITASGVDQVTKTFIVRVNAPPVITITSNLGNDVSKGKVVNLTATGTGISYVWANAAGIVAGQNSAVLSVRPAQNTTYTVTATTSTGCQSQQSFTLNVVDDYQAIELSNVMTPNGDGVNDYLVIKDIDLYPQNELRILNRMGSQIYSKKGYKNDWNATFRGAALPEGIYYYVVDFGQGKPKLKGNITIVRD